ncbi:MFS transporter [Gorillibacterium sp. sgz500922]|uniref:MFS transporter n=1 Tax=Gorillibacterium sp. sgz500922 TaxID=3446694 RepID=UPI003F6659F1
MTASKAAARTAGDPTVYRVLFAISLVHLLNDSIQAVFPAMNRIFLESLHLSYTQLGFIAFGLNFTASIIQPIVGMYTDRKPMPLLLPLGMVSTLLGMLLLALTHSYPMVLLSVVLVGIGSAVFHPEGSRVANLAAGPRRGLAQSIFQVGGNGGQALAPVFTLFILLPLGQPGAIWFTLVAGLAVLVQCYVARWYGKQLALGARKARSSRPVVMTKERKRQIAAALWLLIFLVFVRSWYHASILNFFTSFLVEHRGLSDNASQYYLFAFLGAGAVGTFAGGPLADRFGRKAVLFFSMLGAAPFALALPYASAPVQFVLLLIIGFILLSSFSVAVVYAQELIPGKIGTVSGLITGLAFGLGAVGAVALGSLIDLTSLPAVMKACSFLPLIGVVTYYLPSDAKLREWSGDALS